MKLSAYDAPPGGLLHMQGKGRRFHYVSWRPFEDPICGVALSDCSAGEPANPETEPNATLCPKCRDEALRLYPDCETTTRDAGATDRHPKT